MSTNKETSNETNKNTNKETSNPESNIEIKNETSTKQKYWGIFRDYMEYFLVYCFIGWIYESIWCCLIYHKLGFINRGFLFGPWIPIYGIGFFIIWGIFKLLKVKKPIPVFIVGTLISTGIELLASYIIEATMHRKLWDYTGYFMNFQGRIAFESSMMFGLMIFAAICLIQPGIEKLQGKIRDSKIHNIIFAITTTLFFIDLIARIWLGSNMK